MAVKKVTIENEKFILIYRSGHYGTISYNDIDDFGRVKRPLNGFDMCARKTEKEAIKARRIQIRLAKLKEIGLTEEQLARVLAIKIAKGEW